MQKNTQRNKGIPHNPTDLVSPRVREMLFLYLDIFEFVVSGVLVHECKQEQKPIYYGSKTLLEASILRE